MKLHFLGANRQVTGSRYMLEAGGLKLMIDCGLFQERAFQHRNWEPSPVPPAGVDHVLLTHAHLDHVGLVPKLVVDGFNGPVHATAATVDLAEIVLRDTAKIQMEDAQYKRRRHRKEGRRGPRPVVPLYDNDDVDRAMRRFHRVPMHVPVQLNDAVSVTWHVAGHILGSAMLEVRVREAGEDRVVVFSGDIGQADRPLVRDPHHFTRADVVVMESTYGDRDHQRPADMVASLGEVIRRTARRGGNVVIPTFAIERAQELIYHIGHLVRDDRIPDLPIYLDSPMAVSVTDVFQRYRHELDAETSALIASGRSPFRYPGLKLVRTVEESMAINRLNTPAVIMAGSGMCTGGRIKHHLRHNLERHESTILFVGYQAHGTLGREIVEGRRHVRIHGRMHNVAADVQQLNGFSAHADRSGLLRWLDAYDPRPGHLFLTHGEASAADQLAETIRRRHPGHVEVPEYGQTVSL